MFVRQTFEMVDVFSVSCKTKKNRINYERNYNETSNKEILMTELEYFFACPL